VQLKRGMRLWSQTSTAAVIVVKAPAGEATELLCGGEPMVPAAPAVPPAETAVGDRVELGKRYTDEAGQLELVCTVAGSGPLSLEGAVLTIKAARSLPASD
jgi:hypothetical protein